MPLPIFQNLPLVAHHVKRPSIILGHISVFKMLHHLTHLPQHQPPHPLLSVQQPSPSIPPSPMTVMRSGPSSLSISHPSNPFSTRPPFRPTLPPHLIQTLPMSMTPFIGSNKHTIRQSPFTISLLSSPL